ncbi:MAG: hypothetical protein ABEJ74_05585 [Haloferacaceae archaeon]
MSAALLELLPELLELAFFGLGTVALTVFGAYVERFALVTAQAGSAKLGAVVGLIGAVALYFAYLMATDKLSPKVAQLRRVADATE